MKLIQLLNGYLKLFNDPLWLSRWGGCFVGVCGVFSIWFAFCFYRDPKRHIDRYILNQRIDTFQFIKRFGRFYALEQEIDCMLNREYHFDTKVVAHKKTFVTALVSAGLFMISVGMWLVF